MTSLYELGKPLNERKPDGLDNPGRQALDLLALASLGLAVPPGFVIPADWLRRDFAKAFAWVESDGISNLQKATARLYGERQAALNLKITLMPDALLEPNPEAVLRGTDTIALRQTLQQLLATCDSDPLNQELPAALIVQHDPGAGPDALTRAEYLHRDSLTGRLLRDSESGQSELPGGELHSRLQEAGAIVERYFLDIRQLTYSIEKSHIWILGYNAITQTVPARLKLVADLFRSEAITRNRFLRAISPEETASLFQPTVDRSDKNSLDRITGGLTGSTGACSGRIFFSPKKLLEAHREAKKNGQPSDFILFRKTTHAEDLEAIRLSCGVITSQGGYTSHAPIVARYFGKPAVIHPEAEPMDDRITIAGKTVSEGQYLTLECNTDQPPIIYLGQARIRSTHFQSEDLTLLLDEASSACTTTRVRANADTTEEAELARSCGADGIGLCRTEHMLTGSKALRQLQTFIASENPDEKAAVLSALEVFYEEAFRRLFEIMEGRPLAIRLLDAPLHEFMAETGEEGFLRQTNPMLGLRGCRLGLLYPRLYDMQIRAILHAALKVQSGQNLPQPDVLIPFVMSAAEIKILKNGRSVRENHPSGINAIVRSVCAESGLETLPFPFRVGAVIEVPGAALAAPALARHVEIFSFGTNDLTQTTLGISRDDIGSILPLYQELAVWEDDPFRSLVEPLRKQIRESVTAARAVRPDLETGICGEAGVDRDTARFAVDLGLNYISCAAREVPAVMLHLARAQIEN